MPVAPSVYLAPITPENVLVVCGLDVLPEQRSFVSPNAVSLAEAYVKPHAVPLAVVTGGDVVGFVMLWDDGDLSRIGVWRLMVDSRFQGRGYGAGAIRAIVEYARARSDVEEIVVGALPGVSGPTEFYTGQGFEPTGEVRADGEVRYRLGVR